MSERYGDVYCTQKMDNVMHAVVVMRCQWFFG